MPRAKKSVQLINSFLKKLDNGDRDLVNMKNRHSIFHLPDELRIPFKESFIPILLGVRDLAINDIKGEYLQLINQKKRNYSVRFPLFYNMKNSEYLIIFNNSCYRGSIKNIGDELFSPNGVLNFLAVVLGVDAKDNIAMALLFGAQRNRPQKTETNNFKCSVDILKNDFISIEIMLNGDNNYNYVNELKMHTGQYWKCFMGLLSLEQIINRPLVRSVGERDSYFGFPGSDRYLRDNIDKLGPYLIKTASLITKRTPRKKCDDYIEP